MSLSKKILLMILIVFIGIQFIRPALNQSDPVLAMDISKLIQIPDSVQTLLKNACYDCHSNSINYPWYINIQPMGWLMAKHIKRGKETLNFSEFGNYSPRRRLSKLTGVANSIRDDVMPIFSYRLMHKNARLTEDETTLIINWVQQSNEMGK